MGRHQPDDRHHGPEGVGTDDRAAECLRNLRTTTGAATGVNGWNNIDASWYLVGSDGSLTNVDGVTGGDGMTSSGQLPLVEVSVQNVATGNLMPNIPLPGLGTMAPPVMSAVAWDRMESQTLTGVPAMYGAL